MWLEQKPLGIHALHVGSLQKGKKGRKSLCKIHSREISALTGKGEWTEKHHFKLFQMWDLGQICNGYPMIFLTICIVQFNWCPKPSKAGSQGTLLTSFWSSCVCYIKTQAGNSADFFSPYTKNFELNYFVITVAKTATLPSLLPRVFILEQQV